MDEMNKKHVNKMANLIFDALCGVYDLYTFDGCQKLARELYRCGCVVIKRKNENENEIETGVQ